MSKLKKSLNILVGIVFFVIPIINVVIKTNRLHEKSKNVRMN